MGQRNTRISAAAQSQSRLCQSAKNTHLRTNVAALAAYSLPTPRSLRCPDVGPRTTGRSGRAPGPRGTRISWRSLQKTKLYI